MHALHTLTGAYPLTAAAIIAANPNMIFPVPFELPDDHVWVAEAFPPAYDPLTHAAVELQPVELDGVWTQAWQVEPLAPDVIAERAQLAAAALASASDAARARINTWRDAQEAAGILFEHDGRAWDGGLAVRQRLQPLLSLPAVPDGFFWTDADNNDVPVTLADLAALAQAHEVAIITRGFAIHVRQREMRAGLDAMDLGQLGAFVPGWPA